jgi:hypothetical protein
MFFLFVYFCVSCLCNTWHVSWIVLKNVFAKQFFNITRNDGKIEIGSIKQRVHLKLPSGRKTKIIFYCPSLRVVVHFNFDLIRKLEWKFNYVYFIQLPKAFPAVGFSLREVLKGEQLWLRTDFRLFIKFVITWFPYEYSLLFYHQEKSLLSWVEKGIFTWNYLKHLEPSTARPAETFFT